jgi:hypothetical protein
LPRQELKRLHERVTGRVEFFSDPIGRDAMLRRRTTWRICLEVNNHKPPRRTQRRFQLGEILGPVPDVVISVHDENNVDSVKFELTDQTRQAVDDYLKAASKKPGEFLFTGRRGTGRNMTTRQYARLLSGWVASIGLDPKILAPIRSGEPRRR